MVLFTEKRSRPNHSYIDFRKLEFLVLSSCSAFVSAICISTSVRSKASSGPIADHQEAQAKSKSICIGYTNLRILSVLNGERERDVGRAAYYHLKWLKQQRHQSRRGVETSVLQL